MATHLVVGGNRYGQRQTVPHGRRVTMPKLKPTSILRASDTPSGTTEFEEHDIGTFCRWRATHSFSKAG